MKVLVIGGTGYIGTAVVTRLHDAGHHPVILVRDPDRAPFDVPTRTGDLTDPDSLRAALTPDIDAVVHAATPTGNWDTDIAALAAMTDALAGKVLVYLSGVWVLGPTPDAVDESAPANPIEIVSGRPRLEQFVLNANQVRGVVIRPGIVHGVAGGGIPGMMTGWARAAGTGRYVGEPTVRWPMVHVDDLADLVVLAVDRAPAGTVLHAITESAVPVKDSLLQRTSRQAAAERRKRGTRRTLHPRFGAPFAEALALHQEVTAKVAHDLGWTPTHVDAVSELSEANR